MVYVKMVNAGVLKSLVTIMLLLDKDFFLFFTSCVQLFDCFDVFRLKQNQSFGERLSQLERFYQSVIL